MPISNRNQNNVAYVSLIRFVRFHSFIPFHSIYSTSFVLPTMKPKIETPKLIKFSEQVWENRFKSLLKAACCVPYPHINYLCDKGNTNTNTRAQNKHIKCAETCAVSRKKIIERASEKEKNVACVCVCASQFNSIVLLFNHFFYFQQRELRWCVCFQHCWNCNRTGIVIVNVCVCEFQK